MYVTRYAVNIQPLLSNPFNWFVMARTEVLTIEDSICAVNSARASLERSAIEM